MTVVYSLHGVDGTGKSTQAALLRDHLQARGERVHDVWFRFHHRRSLGALAVARLVGASWVEQHGEHKIGFHDFTRHPRLGRAYLALLHRDMRLAYRHKVAAPLQAGKNVVLDRFVLDTVVDLSLSFDDPDFVDSPPARRFLDLAPEGARAVVLDPGASDLRPRRPDLFIDPDRDERIRRYQDFADRLAIPRVHADQPVEDVARDVRKALGVAP